MIAPGENAQGNSEAVSARPNFCGPPRTAPALWAMPPPGLPMYARPVPSPGLAVAVTTPPSTSPPPTTQQPKPFDRLRKTLRSRYNSRRTERAYCHWVKRSIFPHRVRHPAAMAVPEFNAFLPQLAPKGRVSASTQDRDLSALLPLERHVLGRRIGEVGDCWNRGGKGVRNPADALALVASADALLEKGRSREGL